MTKPITLAQKSRILDFVAQHVSNRPEDFWKHMDVLEASTASDIIETFYQRNYDVAINQLKHLDIL